MGNTSLLPYPTSPAEGNINVKAEFENPTGSMKDRIAFGMVTLLEKRGVISQGDLLVEASSGNTAGGLALVANRRDYDAVITAPIENSPQKLGYVEALGAELVACPDVSADDERYYRTEAKRIAEERNGVWLDQYTNQLNPEVHSRWTGPELTDQYPDLTHVIAPMGTGGTMSGIAKWVKEYDSSITTIGVDAIESNISTAFDGETDGEHSTDVEGLGKGEKLPTMWFEYIDDVRSVSDADSFRQARRAANEHGILIGGSSGAALFVAHEIATQDPDSEIAVLACDGGEQYFDTLFDDDWLADRGYEF
ncbi:PLP-dependent cysteine synthase family protein [Natronosalvus rutilus]|uniref:PLP-dependent cysteine synthase family protein n=1 Tax=Natronosalvus rutilus TaxID=2953753 RepID=UPI003CCE3B31